MDYKVLMQEEMESDGVCPNGLIITFCGESMIKSGFSVFDFSEIGNLWGMENH